MAVKIRLMRIGAKKRPFYRVVAVDEHKKRTGAYIELLGTYNPLTQPKEIILKQDRIDDWIKKGAVLSDGFLRITGKAPQRPARKPKKEKAAPVAVPQPTETVETPVESDTPAESSQVEVETPTHTDVSEDNQTSKNPEEESPTPQSEPASSEEAEEAPQNTEPENTEAQTENQE